MEYGNITHSVCLMFDHHCVLISHWRLLSNGVIRDLNIRKGPGTNFKKTGQYTGIGVFTIVEVADGQGSTAGWGRLKSGAGWCNLDYCQKI